MNTPPYRTRAAGFLIIGALLAASAFLITANANASDIPGPPSAPCGLGERMNVIVVEGWMYECACSVLATGFHCEWNLVGEVVDTNAARKLKRHTNRHAHRRLIPVLVIHPVVVA